MLVNSPFFNIYLYYYVGMTQEDNLKNKDAGLDLTLRPQIWDDYIGQEKIKKNLQIIIGAAKIRHDPIEHILLYGPAGLGKTTLANLISQEIGGNLRITSGPIMEKTGDLASILTNLNEGDILFIDEAHRLNKAVEEVLYPAMESRVLDIIIGKGASAKILQIHLPPFSIIAATTRIDLLSSPFRSRFGGTFKLDFYTEEDIEKIIIRSSKVLGIKIEEDAISTIAKSSRATPRTANRLLKRVRDFAQMHGEKIITNELAEKALKLLEIDELGLETSDKHILQVIISKYNGGPVGLKTIAASCGEEERTVEDVYEPYLMRLGFIARTPKGRVVTELGYKHLCINQPNQNQSSIFQPNNNKL